MSFWAHGIDVLNPYEATIITGDKRKRGKRMTEAELRMKMYWICCPMCDNDKCRKGTPKCEAEQWLEKKLKGVEST